MELEAYAIKLKTLKSHIENGDSVLMTITNDRNQGVIPHLEGIGDAPYDYQQPPFELPLVKLSFFPLRIPLLQQLTGVLTARDLEYETPRHKDVFRGILRKEIKHYTGHCFYEHTKRS